MNGLLFSNTEFVIQVSLIAKDLITQDLEHVRIKFNFSEVDMRSVPQNPFTYLREIFKDTAFRASQFKMLNKLIYARKLLKICYEKYTKKIVIQVSVMQPRDL